MPLGVGASYTVIVQQTSGEVLAIGEENSYASRLLGDHSTSLTLAPPLPNQLRSLEEFSLFFPFVSMIVLHGKERETCVEERKGAQKSGGECGRSEGWHRNGGMRGRAWTYVVIDRWIGLGGRGEDIVFFFIYTPVSTVSLVS